MIHLRARVQRKGGGDGSENEETVSENAAHIPTPDLVEIEQIPNGYLLIHVYLGHTPFVHTWHETLEEAKAEAKSDFLVGEDTWKAVPLDERAE
jgi:hypothetical protein